MYTRARAEEVGEKLAGLRVTGAAYDPDMGAVGITFSDGTLVWVLADEEANGPGHLDFDTVPRG